MKKIIFYSFPAHGHTNPTIAVAKELVKRGNKVTYYSIAPFKEKVESAGLVYRSYDIDKYLDNFQTAHVSILAKGLMDVATSQIATLQKEAEKEKPDAIIYDSLCLWGKIVAKSQNIPAVSLFTTFAFNKIITRKYAYWYFAELRREIFQTRNTFMAYIAY